MKELLRSNDLVLLSWAEALLDGAGIGSLVLDTHASAIEGSISAIPRRLMVDDDDWQRAKRLIDHASPSGG